MLGKASLNDFTRLIPTAAVDHDKLVEAKRSRYGAA